MDEQVKQEMAAARADTADLGTALGHAFRWYSFHSQARFGLFVAFLAIIALSAATYVYAYNQNNVTLEIAAALLLAGLSLILMLQDRRLSLLAELAATPLRDLQAQLAERTGVPHLDLARRGFFEDIRRPLHFFNVLTPAYFFGFCLGFYLFTLSLVLH